MMWLSRALLRCLFLDGILHYTSSSSFKFFVLSVLLCLIILGLVKALSNERDMPQKAQENLSLKPSLRIFAQTQRAQPFLLVVAKCDLVR